MLICKTILVNLNEVMLNIDLKRFIWIVEMSIWFCVCMHQKNNMLIYVYSYLGLHQDNGYIPIITKSIIAIKIPRWSLLVVKCKLWKKKFNLYCISVRNMRNFRKYDYISTINLIFILKIYIKLINNNDTNEKKN